MSSTAVIITAVHPGAFAAHLKTLKATAKAIARARRRGIDCYLSVGVDGTREDLNELRTRVARSPMGKSLRTRTRYSCTLKRECGTTAAQNIALHMSPCTDFILLNDADDLWAPDGIADLAHPMLNQPDLWWSVGAKSRRDRKGRNYDAETVEPFAGIREPGTLYPPGYGYRSNVVAASNLALRTPLMHAIGFRSFVNANDTATLAIAAELCKGIVIPSVVVRKNDHSHQKKSEPGYEQRVIQYHYAAITGARSVANGYSQIKPSAYNQR